MKKFAMFAFNGDPMCFIHVLLNTLDLNEKGHDVKLVIEGSAVKLIGPMANEEHPLHNLYAQCIEKGLVSCVCQACAHKLGSLDEAKKQNLPLCHDMAGHPSMSSYVSQGYEIISF